MGNQRPAPGTDEIIVSPSRRQRYCARREHAIANVPVQVVVTFGTLGEAGRVVLFPGCSRRSYPLCRECWEATRHLTHTVWAGLTFHDTG